MTQALIQILTGGLGSVGFSILFNLRGRKLLITTIGGLISWAVFLVLENWIPGESMRYFLAMAAITVYAEIFARVEKTPTTTFLVPCVIPLIPGSALYYTMNFAVRGDLENFTARGTHTVAIAGVMAVGILLISTLFRLFTVLKSRKKP